MQQRQRFFSPGIKWLIGEASTSPKAHTIIKGFIIAIQPIIPIIAPLAPRELGYHEKDIRLAKIPDTKNKIKKFLLPINFSNIRPKSKRANKL